MKNHKINVEIIYPDLPAHLEQTINRAAHETLTLLAADKQVELTVLVCDDDYMQELNLTYRGQDKTTDVLSFEDRFDIPDSDISYMGDIAISYPTAVKQALHFGHELESEISLLTVHGILHLLGYVHQDDTSKTAMWAIQSTLMKSLGFTNFATLADEIDA